MRLLLFVGAGDPTLNLYRRVYSLLEDSATRYGYSSVDWSMRWPGQGPGALARQETLDFAGAVTVARRIIDYYESCEEDYHLLGRSFGALVAAYCMVSMQPRRLKRLILWGPPVYWMMWQKFVSDFENSKAFNLSKGVHINRDYFASLVPFESLLPRIAGPTLVATGSHDSYCSPAYIQYLRSLGKNDNITFRVVEGAPHEVTSDLPPLIVSSYLTTLFGRTA